MRRDILHFATDDKFVPLAIELFEAAFPGRNCVRLLRKHKPTRFVKLTESVSEFEPEDFDTPELRAQLADSRMLVVHGMRANFVEAIRTAPPSVRVVWCGWGFDYYPLLEPQLGPALLPLTEAAVTRQTSSRTMPLLEVASRIDICSVMPTEFDDLRAAVPELRATLHPLRYYTIEDTFSNYSKPMAGNDVLVGNSGDSTNNHLDTFEALRRLDFGDSRVLVPLSYGGKPEYLDEVMTRGREIFGDRFVPLQTFLPLAEFNAAIEQCGSVVMNHRRQQALGTSIQALYRGARVYLRPESATYRLFVEQGLAVDRWEPDATFGEPPSEHTVMNNRDRLVALWSRERAIAQIVALA